MKIKTIAMASDHAGYEYKELLKSHLESKGFQVEDFGTHSTDSVDYPDFIKPAAYSELDRAKRRTRQVTRTLCDEKAKIWK